VALGSLQERVEQIFADIQAACRGLDVRTRELEHARRKLWRTVGSSAIGLHASSS
jgi:hypothetical protein